jgi:hypothetical protein
MNLSNLLVSIVEKYLNDDVVARRSKVFDIGGLAFRVLLRLKNKEPFKNVDSSEDCDAYIDIYNDDSPMIFIVRYDHQSTHGIFDLMSSTDEKFHEVFSFIFKEYCRFYEKDQPAS